MKTSKFRKGQKVVCLHYADKPVVIVNEYIPATKYEIAQVWVTEPKGGLWWAPATWFKKVGK